VRKVGPQLWVRLLGVAPAYTFHIGAQVRYMIGSIIYPSETPELYLEEVGPLAPFYR
jgi:hypothetical protein